MTLNKVVAATDFSESSLVAIETAFNLDLAPGGHVYLLHSLDFLTGVDPAGTVMPATEDFWEEAQAQLRSLVPDNIREDVTVETEVLMGRPAGAIANFARDIGADLIVVGTHGRTGLTRVLLGSTAEELLRMAPCQVLVAKHKVYIADPVGV